MQVLIESSHVWNAPIKVLDQGSLKYVNNHDVEEELLRASGFSTSLGDSLESGKSFQLMNKIINPTYSYDSEKKEFVCQCGFSAPYSRHIVCHLESTNRSKVVIHKEGTCKNKVRVFVCSSCDLRTYDSLYIRRHIDCALRQKGKKGFFLPCSNKPKKQLKNKHEHKKKYKHKRKNVHYPWLQENYFCNFSTCTKQIFGFKTAEELVVHLRVVHKKHYVGPVYQHLYNRKEGKFICRCGFNTPYLRCIECHLDSTVPNRENIVVLHDTKNKRHLCILCGLIAKCSSYMKFHLNCPSQKKRT